VRHQLPLLAVALTRPVHGLRASIPLVRGRQPLQTWWTARAGRRKICSLWARLAALRLAAASWPAIGVTLCVLLWARDGGDVELRQYEGQVLALLTDHDGQVIHRAHVIGDDGPSEVQILRLGSEDALAAYLSDPRRTALAGQRDAAIERTDVLRIQLEGPGPGVPASVTQLRCRGPYAPSG